MSDTNIVPFGKYKGRPIEEVIETDPSYLHWLAGQDWFRARYVSLHQTIINRGAEPEETPEHNALQALFLDDGFCVRFLMAQHKTTPEQQRQKALHHEQKALNQAKSQLATLCEGAWQRDGLQKEINSRQKEIDMLSAAGEFKMEITRREFEERGIDVCLSADFQYNGQRLGYFSAGVEIKPAVGDDYPAVLRQMRRTHSDTLFLETYTGTGATAEQMASMFQTAGIVVVYRREC
jgi:hypothetical protein